MVYIEEGKEKEETVVLLHAGGLGPWMYKKAVDILAKSYHVVCVVLDGHSSSDAPFVSIEENAKKVEEYIQKKCKGKVLALCGVSLGGQICCEILARNKDICKVSVIESAVTRKMQITHSLVKVAVNMSHCLVAKKWFAKMQAKALHIPEEMFAEYFTSSKGIAKEDLQNILLANTSYLAKESLAFCNAKVYVFAGGKERKVVIDSAKDLGKILPCCKVCILPEYTHGQLTLQGEKLAGVIIAACKEAK